jgi:hypothetical protein
VSAPDWRDVFVQALNSIPLGEAMDDAEYFTPEAADAILEAIAERGCIVAPREPTNEMVAAAKQNHWVCDGESSLAEVYRDMLAAHLGRFVPRDPPDEGER